MAVGQRAPMIDAVDRVTGRLGYTLNFELPGMLVGRLLRSPHPHARLRRIDISRAERVPGVIAILTRHDLIDEGQFDPFYGPLVRDQPVVALDVVRYAGEPVAAVAAVDEENADRALDLIDVEYDLLPAVFDPLEALKPEAPRLHEGGNVQDHLELSQGDLEQGFREADLIVEEEYRTAPVQHVPLEPHVAVALVEGRRVTVWSATQTPHNIRAQLAAIFKLPLSHVRVIVSALGGAYGSKCYPKLEPIAALLAWKAGRPVRLALSRAEDFLASRRSAAIIRLKTGVKRDGTIVARHVVAYFDKGAYTETGSRVVRNGAWAAVSAYRAPHTRLEAYSVFTNLPPSGPYRAPGVAQTIWAAESHMDAIARRLGMDSLALRRKNLVRNGDRFIGGGELEDLHFEELLDAAARAIGWDERPRAEPGSSLRRGKAITLTLKTSRTPSTSTAICKLNEDGSLTVMISSVEMGQGARTALAQIAADAVGVPLECVSVTEPDTDVTPYDDTTSSSRTTSVMGGALRVAGADLRRQLTRLAAEALEVAPEDLELAAGRATVRGAPDRSMSYGELVRRSRQGNLLGHGTFTNVAKPDPLTGRPGASTHWHHAVAAAEVEVDTETGKIRVARFHAGAYVGQVVNPLLCELQMEGSVIFGLGQGLLEELIFDDGRLTNPNLSDYMVPSFLDVPHLLEAHVLSKPASDEIHGIGETALSPVMAAIGNAVADAVGVTSRALPITPERVLRALQHQQEEA